MHIQTLNSKFGLKSVHLVSSFFAKCAVKVLHLIKTCVVDSRLSFVIISENRIKREKWWESMLLGLKSANITNRHGVSSVNRGSEFIEKQDSPDKE